MAKPRLYTDEQFVEAVASSFSIREVLKKIGVQPTGGNYKVAKIRIQSLGLDVSHFTGKGHLKGKKRTWKFGTPLPEILIENSDYQSNKLRKRLIAEGYFEEKCYCCGLREWLGKKIVLELEHKNGNSRDNRIENLTLLCLNCHAQTSTFRRRKSNDSKL